MSKEQVSKLAQTLADRLKEDVDLCRTREETIRVSARANEAQLLLQGLNQMFDVTSGLELEDLQADSSPSV